MEILLLILKIIGIILLVLLLLFSVMILSVVLIPVRYRIKGRAASPDEIEADMVISWMLHLVHGRVQISGSDIRYKIRILGIPIPIGREKKHSVPKIKSEGSLDNPQEKEEKIEQDSREAKTEASKTEKDHINEKKTEYSKKASHVAEHPAARETTQKSQKKRKNRSIRRLWEECKAWLMHLKQLAAGFRNKTISWKEQFLNIKNIILEETNKNAVVCLFREFRYLLKHFSPRKASGTLQYGLEDPAITGQVLGIISIFPFWYRYQISVQPDFNAEGLYARGDLVLKGYIRALHLLRTGIRLIKDKNFRRLINQIRK